MRSIQLFRQRYEAFATVLEQACVCLRISYRGWLRNPLRIQETLADPLQIPANGFKHGFSGGAQPCVLL